MTSPPIGSERDRGAEASPGARIPIPADRIDEFLALPPARASTDPRFDVRRLHPSEFELAYECVDAGFARTRPRAVFDWWYRRNPYGKARVWVVAERTTGRVVKTGADFPWPIWRGDEPLRGSVGGDAATVPELQRRGLSHLRRGVQRSHPWYGTICSISGPNATSRLLVKKRGESEKILGRLPGGVLPLPFGRTRRPRAAGAAIATFAAGVAGTSLAAWRRLALPRRTGALRVAPLARFEQTFDAITLRTMRFAGFWSPHNASFLNWRYIDHPGETYTAFALYDGIEPVGYAVVLFDRDRALLSEFAVDATPRERAAALLTTVLDAARDAGCRYAYFFGTPVWRHWGLFRAAGMLPYPTKNFFEVSYDRGPPSCRDIRMWQVVPGDRDYH